ncbi:MAG: ABC transporter permease [Dehalococcoidia bacterium]|nr:ABC transporter permease [Dehalococcoidia bacterium]
MKLLYSFLKDMQLSLKSFYIYIELGFALVFVAVMLFAVPENFEPKVTVYAYLDLKGPNQGMAEESLTQEGYEVILLLSREEVEAKLADNRSSVGLAVTLEDGRIVYDYILQGYEDEKFKNIIKTSIESGFAREMPGYENVTTVTTLEANVEKLSDRLNILPVFLALNAAFMGLFIIASYIFLDKDEGTIRAFAVTPAKVWHYLLSKMGVMLVSGLMSGLVATAFIAGLKAHYLHLILLLIACNAFGSALGLFIASFFDTMTKAMGWLYMSIIVLAFAVVSYYTPAFSPLVIRMLPSYPMLFAFRETLYKVSDLRYIYANVLGFSLAGAVLFLLSNWRFKKTLTV